MSRRHLFLIPPLLLALPACEGLGQVCDTSIRPSIVVEIQDSVTGVPVAGGAFARVIDGTYEDTLTPYSSDGLSTVLSLAMRGERVGVYLVEVRQTGYLTWQRGGVRVTSGDCHTSQANLLARLVAGP